MARTDPRVVVRFGADRLVDDPSMLGRVRRVGLLTNDAARLSAAPDVRTRAALMKAGVPLTVLLSPEHGLTARGVDGGAMADAIDALTGLPVVSLYGERFAPPAEVLASIDLLLVDLPDIGARFYTYAWTMTHALDACARTGTRVLVLDRPNPLGGELTAAEGPLLEDAYHSLLGRLDIPVRHSLTMGELARLWQRERAPNVELQVVPCEGWARAMQWPDTGLAFVPTSPDMPSFESALLYPGTCLFEATNVSVGRGSAAPFRTMCAPWLDGAGVTDALSADGRLDGVALDGSIGQLTLRVAERRAVRPVAIGLALLECVFRLHHADFSWSTYPTAANPSGREHLERLIGAVSVRESLEAGSALAPDLVRVSGWASRVEPVLVYPV